MPSEGKPVDGQTSCKDKIPRLLLDAPVRTDQFGPHNQIAEAILQIVKTQSGGFAIGLLGTWGSGKSTVLEILRGKTDHGVSCFVFDAWAHTGDPLRRVFIERLLDFAGESLWISGAEREFLLKSCLEQKTITQTTSKPRLTGFGIGLAVSLLLVPLGQILLRHADDFSNGQLVWTAYAMLVAPILWLSLALTTGIIGAAGALIFKWRKPEVQDFIPITGTSASTTIADTSKHPEISSVDFERAFDSIIEQCVACNSDRKLIIALDNLDRIDAERARELWSAMQTFLSASKSKTKGLDSTFFCVPLDPNAIKALWRSSGEEPVSQDLAISFLQKTFRTVFHVPAALPSRWHRYFLGRAKAVFPFFEDEIEDLYYVFAKYREPRAVPPTPREITYFLNSCGGLFLLWGESIELKILAYYAVLRQGLAFDLDAIMQASEDFSLRASLGEDYRDQLCAMAMGVGPGDAVEVYLRSRLIEQFGSGSMPASELVENPHFWPTMRQVWESATGRDEPINVSPIGIGLFVASMKDRAVQARSLWKSVADYVKGQAAWGSPYQGSAGLINLVLMECDLKEGRHMLNGYCNSVPLWEQSNTGWQGWFEDWLAGLHQIWLTAEEKFRAADLDDIEPQRLQPAQWALYLALKRQTGWALPKFPAIHGGQTFDFVAEKIRSENIDSRDALALQELLDLGDADRTARALVLAEGAKGHLLSCPSSLDRIKGAVHALQVLDAVPSVANNEMLKHLAQQGYLSHGLAVALRNRDWPFGRMLRDLIISVGVDPASFQAPGDAAQVREFLQQFSSDLDLEPGDTQP